MSNVIAIDGPSSAGKSTIGLSFAHRIKYQFIDSGVIYRSLPFYLLKHNLPTSDEERNAKILADFDPTFQADQEKVRVFSGGEEITRELHTPEVRNLVAFTSAQRKVRDAIKEKQIQIASKTNTVMSGRDIGTEIFPDSKLKFYLDADIQVRAKRRYLEIKKKDPKVTLQSILKELEERDFKDKTREVSPLYPAPDAIIIDTSQLSKDQVLNLMLEYFKNSSYS